MDCTATALRGIAVNKPVEHHCLLRPARPCLLCGEMLEPPVYCAVCGAEVTPPHICVPRPLAHTCPPSPPPGRCLACGEALPTPLFCATCGADITPVHRCKAAPPTQIPRPDPLHICPAYELEHCEQCGALLPGQTYCTRCGMDITPAHVCKPSAAPHACPPHLTMPRRCSHCGEMLPAPQHCTRCGANITAIHVCD
jgi:hypothetical protein